MELHTKQLINRYEQCCSSPTLLPKMLTGPSWWWFTKKDF